MREEQRIKMRIGAALEKSEQAPLLLKQHQGLRPKCSYCGKLGHLEAKCCKKLPDPSRRKKNPTTKALLAAAQGDKDDETIICLMAKLRKQGIPEESGDRCSDSACTAHMTCDQSAFVTFTGEQTAGVEVGTQENTFVMGRGDVKHSLLVQGLLRECMLRNVLYVPDLGFQLFSVSEKQVRS